MVPTRHSATVAVRTGLPSATVCGLCTEVGHSAAFCYFWFSLSALLVMRRLSVSSPYPASHEHACLPIHSTHISTSDRHRQWMASPPHLTLLLLSRTTRTRTNFYRVLAHNVHVHLHADLPHTVLPSNYAVQGLSSSVAGAGEA